MAIKQQSVPHFGVREGYARKEGKGFTGKTCYHDDPAKAVSFKSVGQAKRFMRTGDAGPAPCVYKASNASKYLTRRTAAAQKLAQIRAKNLSSPK